MSAQLTMNFDDDEPVTAIWQVECPDCGAPAGVTCVKAGSMEAPLPGPDARYNHQARREKKRQIWREQQRQQFGDDWHKSRPYYNPE